MKKNTILLIVITAIIIFNIASVLFPLAGKFTVDYNERYPQLKKMYYDSIYANKKGNFIRDEYVYSFAGGALIQGISPILVNPEVPPLGKYFISLSILLFKNEHVTTILFGLGSVVLLFILGRQVFSSSLLALLPVLLLTFEPLFLNQFRITPLLDIMQLFFLLGYFVLFNIALNRKNNIPYFLLTNIMLGCFISVKFFGTGVTLIGAAMLLLLLRRDIRNTIRYVATSIIAPVILLSSYIAVLFSGYSIGSFLGIQKWVFLYNTGHLSKYFTFFPLFLFNKWYSWWDTSVMSDFQWQFTWPLSFLLLVFVLFMYFKYKKYRNKALDIILTWVALYILILQTGYMSARYFVILLPPLFLISIYGLKILALEILERRK